MTEEQATYQTRGGSRMDAPVSVMMVERALLAARMLTDAVERDIGNAVDMGAGVDRVLELRANADDALFDAERAMGLVDQDAELVRTGFASWPPEGWDIDRARRLLNIERGRYAIELAMVVCAEWSAEKAGGGYRGVASIFGCANDSLIECATALQRERVRELAEERRDSLAVAQ